MLANKWFDEPVTDLSHIPMHLHRLLKIKIYGPRLHLVCNGEDFGELNLKSSYDFLIPLINLLIGEKPF